MNPSSGIWKQTETPINPQVKRTILFVVNDSRYFVTHRLALAKGIRDAGYVVHVAGPIHGFATSASLIKEAGFHLHNVGIARQGINPVQDVSTFRRLVQLYRDLRPDIVHHVTVKPILYGSLAAQIARIRGVVNAVSGLGRLLTHHNVRSRLRSNAMLSLYRLVLQHPNTITIFQNANDRSTFIHRGIVHEASSVLIEGSGTELSLFNPSAEPDYPPIVLFPGRILRQKGVREFIAAARRLKVEGTAARFAIVGDRAGNRDALSTEELENVRAEGAVELWGWSDNIPAAMARAAIVCLPSYHEGLPKALIDACAAGRPIVATDIAGCRAAVTNGVNGLLVRPRDIDSLVCALRLLIADPSLRERMGREGRERAIAKFDVALVVSSTVKLYERLLASGHTSDDRAASINERTA